jgi:hypothetical protein
MSEQAWTARTVAVLRRHPIAASSHWTGAVASDSAMQPIANSATNATRSGGRTRRPSRHAQTRPCTSPAVAAPKASPSKAATASPAQRSSPTGTHSPPMSTQLDTFGGLTRNGAIMAVKPSPATNEQPNGSAGRPKAAGGGGGASSSSPASGKGASSIASSSPAGAAAARWARERQALAGLAHDHASMLDELV